MDISYNSGMQWLELTNCYFNQLSQSELEAIVAAAVSASSPLIPYTHIANLTDVPDLTTMFDAHKTVLEGQPKILLIICDEIDPYLDQLDPMTLAHECEGWRCLQMRQLNKYSYDQERIRSVIVPGL